MRLFITIEAQRATETGIADIFCEVNEKLSFITKKDKGLEDIDNYGTEFREISVIPTCVDDDCWNSLGWKERKSIQYKKKEADIRLRIDYSRFINETYENKRLMFINVIVKSINIIQEKSKADFKGDRLVNDILYALNVSPSQLTNFEI